MPMTNNDDALNGRGFRYWRWFHYFSEYDKNAV